MDPPWTFPETRHIPLLSDFSMYPTSLLSSTAGTDSDHPCQWCAGSACPQHAPSAKRQQHAHMLHHLHVLCFFPRSLGPSLGSRLSLWTWSMPSNASTACLLRKPFPFESSPHPNASCTNMYEVATGKSDGLPEVPDHQLTYPLDVAALERHDVGKAQLGLPAPTHEHHDVHNPIVHVAHAAD